jgi:serine/threonine-protein kinase
MAEVYRAYQENLDRYVAIKLMHSFLADEQDFLTRFKREAKAMASLNHRNIVGVYDFDIQDGMYYIVMKFVSGGTLKQKLESMASKDQRLSLAYAIRIVLEIADALAYAHGRGMVHRDIKPGNIMLDEDGHAVLTDFGIAKILSGPSFTATGAMIGTPAYMSPEQGLGQPGDERSDLYALGVLFYQMATGRLPYEADTPLAVILKHVNDPVPAPSILNVDIPTPIQEVLVKSLAKKPENRYQTAVEMARDLQSAASDSNLELAAGISLDVISDRHTPLPETTAASATKVGKVEPTVLSAGALSASMAAETRLASPTAIAQTDIADPSSQTTEASAPPAVIEPEKRSGIAGWLIGGGIILFLLLAGAAALYFIVFRPSTETPTPEQSVVVAAIETATQKPTPTEEPRVTVDAAGTAVAAIAATLTAVPTQTTPPQSTETPIASPTPDVTGTFIASCEEEIELVESYTFDNVISKSAPAGSRFPMTWTLRNPSECPVSSGLLWVYQDGEDFGQSGPIVLDVDLALGEEATFQTTLEAPENAGSYSSIWRLEDEGGKRIGPAVEFELVIYDPVTVTPASTNTPAATPTSEAIADLSLAWSVENCEYVGTEWRCQLIFFPGGGGQPYTLFVFDADQPKEYRGIGPFTHFISSRRCSPWIHEWKLQDDGTGDSIGESLFISPDSYFEGGCTQE